jgi:hypothetical protein
MAMEIKLMCAECGQRLVIDGIQPENGPSFIFHFDIIPCERCRQKSTQTEIGFTAHDRVLIEELIKDYGKEAVIAAAERLGR